MATKTTTKPMNNYRIMSELTGPRFITAVADIVAQPEQTSSNAGTMLSTTHSRHDNAFQDYDIPTTRYTTR